MAEQDPFSLDAAKTGAVPFNIPKARFEEVPRTTLPADPPNDPEAVARRLAAKQRLEAARLELRLAEREQIDAFRPPGGQKPPAM